MGSLSRLGQPDQGGTTLDKIGAAARRMREVISPWNVVSPTDVAGFAPGGGLAQAWQDSGRARDNLRAGNYGQAAADYGSMAMNTLGEVAPFAKLGMAMLPAAKKVGGLADIGKAEPQGITAYHGTPHDFDRFDMSKIGTGEGAQAYGHGLYFAENEGIARTYRDNLTADRTAPAKRLLAKHNNDIDAALNAARAEINRLQKLNLTPETGLDRAKSMIETQENNIAALNSLKNSGEMAAGRMYQVRINANPEHFLDWDKPFLEQSAHVKRGLDEAGFAPPPGGEMMTGAQLYERMHRTDGGAWNSPKEFSANALRELGGIPGIKYLDAGSRGAGDGTRNYVVFDDKLVEILKKYGWVPGMAIPAAAMAEYQKGQGGNAPQM